ncbi:MAG: xylulokinase [Candidatus Aminicenantales bacterium]
MAGPKYFIGLDSGTQGTKALIIDEKGKVIGRGYARHQFIPRLKPGESEQAPATWVRALDKSLKMALRQARRTKGFRRQNIVALGISGQQHGFVPLDQNGRVIRPAKLWNDTSTTEETNLILEACGGKKRFIQLVGLPLAVGYTASKILWLKRHEPHNYRRLKTILLPHNYLNFYLTGKRCLEYGDASGTGLMDVRNLKWQDEVIEIIDPELREKLPPLFHPVEPIGYMKKDLARAFNLDKVLVASGGGDNMMAAIGTGNVTPGIFTLSLGTSGTIYTYAPRPVLDYRGEIANFCDSTGAWLPLLCTMNVTNVTELVRKAFGLSLAKMEREARKAPPGAGGLLLLPFIDGERVPVLPLGSGVIFGLNRNTFRFPFILRAIYEGVILNLGYGLSRMKELYGAPEEFRVTGGGSRNRLWLEMAAVVFQAPVRRLKEAEAAAYGAALQAMWTYFIQQGQKISIQGITRELLRLERETIEPQEKLFPVYQELQARFNSLWRTLSSEFEKHSRLNEQNLVI